MRARLDGERAIKDVARDITVGVQYHRVSLDTSDKTSAYGDMRGVDVSLNLAVDLDGAFRADVPFNANVLTDDR